MPLYPTPVYLMPLYQMPLYPMPLYPMPLYPLPLIAMVMPQWPVGFDMKLSQPNRGLNCPLEYVHKTYM